jgi:hypothetical protein
MADDLVTRVCPDLRCGVRYAIPQHIYDQAKSVGDKRSYWCPNGHAAVMTETNEDRLRKQVEDLKVSQAYLNERWAEACKEALQLRRRIAYWRGIAHRKPRAGR